MIYADRARALRRRRGDAPLLIGDAAAASTTIITHTTSPWSTVITAALYIALGAALPITIGFVSGYVNRLDPAEARLVEQTRRRGIDLDRMSASEIDARLSVPADDVEAAVSLLALPDVQPPDLRWVGQLEGRLDSAPTLPSRVETLRAVIAYLDPATPAERSRILDDLRTDAALTERARTVIASLRRAGPADVDTIGRLLTELLDLPHDQLRTLESAGFPAVPRDPDRQAIYQRLATTTEAAANFVWRFVSMPAGRQQAVVAITEALQWKTLNRLSGALRDGDPATLAATRALPQACTANIPYSCYLPQR